MICNILNHIAEYLQNFISNFSAQFQPEINISFYIPGRNIAFLLVYPDYHGVSCFSGMPDYETP
ncbi:MAG: hypothetical protein D6B27_00715 [Gammaproteobacteria bacterium]|nr:MAG: hypothetical protein D6B27_00715 [Gammaproteobacteria bacterium]